ncbi:MAG: CRISPR-associated endoribonuclease Cas6, partial [Pseudanabaena sp.]
MPHSLVVNFMPKTPIYPEYLTGRHIHALFLTLVSSVDKELGDRLHGEKANKGFGLSPIQLAVSYDRNLNKPQLKKANSQQLKAKSLSWHHQEISPSTPCWWRITLLDEVLF